MPITSGANEEDFRRKRRRKIFSITLRYLRGGESALASELGVFISSEGPDTLHRSHISHIPLVDSTVLLPLTPSWCVCHWVGDAPGCDSFRPDSAYYIRARRCTPAGRNKAERQKGRGRRQKKRLARGAQTSLTAVMTATTSRLEAGRCRSRRYTISQS